LKELFVDLEKFVNDPLVRWDYCIRAKRGQADTSRPGIEFYLIEFNILTLLFSWYNVLLIIIIYVAKKVYNIQDIVFKKLKNHTTEKDKCVMEIALYMQNKLH